MSNGFTKLLAAVAIIGAYSVAAGPVLAECAGGVQHSVSASQPTGQSPAPVVDSAGSSSVKGG
jgi:hypothetical protein